LPIFEYRCKKCGHEFEDLVSVAERDEPRVCPACGATGAERLVSVFAARVTGGSGGSSGPVCSPSGST